MPDMQIDSSVDKALAILDAEEGAGSSAATPEDQILERLDSGDAAPGQGAGETAPDTTVEAVEAKETSPIDPPASWKAEAKERFKALPRETQQDIADRESERERGLTKTQQESADVRKAAEADRAAVQDERKSYASRLNVLIDLANTMDPVLAEGRKTDWAKLHKDDPLNAPAKWFEYQTRQQQVQALETQRNDLLNKVRYENYQKGDKVLREKIPEIWADDGKRKAFQSDFAKYLTQPEHGYSPDEAGSIDDYRAILIGRKAMLYDQLMAQQTKIAATKVVPAQGKIVRSQANDDSTDTARSEALAKRARKSGRTDDAVDAIMARL